jgi:hypothetical protein
MADLFELVQSSKKAVKQPPYIPATVFLIVLIA